MYIHKDYVSVCIFVKMLNNFIAICEQFAVYNLWGKLKAIADLVTFHTAVYILYSHVYLGANCYLL